MESCAKDFQSISFDTCYQCTLLMYQIIHKRQIMTLLVDRNINEENKNKKLLKVVEVINTFLKC